jgi:hypothetical protein
VRSTWRMHLRLSISTLSQSARIIGLIHSGRKPLVDSRWIGLEAAAAISTRYPDRWDRECQTPWHARAATYSVPPALSADVSELTQVRERREGADNPSGLAQHRVARFLKTAIECAPARPMQRLPRQTRTCIACPTHRSRMRPTPRSERTRPRKTSSRRTLSE